MAHDQIQLQFFDRDQVVKTKPRNVVLYDLVWRILDGSETSAVFHKGMIKVRGAREKRFSWMMDYLCGEIFQFRQSTAKYFDDLVVSINFHIDRQKCFVWEIVVFHKD